MGVAQNSSQKGLPGPAFEGRYGGQRRVEETRETERAVGLGASSAVLSKTLPKRSQGRTGQTRGPRAQQSPMTAVFCGRFPSCSGQEGGSPGHGRREGGRGGGK